MTTLVLDIADQSELDQIEDLARANRLTREEQAARLIQEALRGHSRAQLRQAFEATAALSPAHVRQTDSVDLIRADRER